MYGQTEDRELKIRESRTRSESGSVFTVLLAGIAIAAAMSVVLYQTISGPMSSMARVTNMTQAKSQMQSVGTIVIMDAVNQGAGGDCDGDGSIEPRPWRTGSGPPGGGLIPSMGAPMTDPWNTDYGYCVWDVGTVQTKCAGTTPNMLVGTPTPATSNAKSGTVIAVISAGPNRHFDTSCRDYDSTGGAGSETKSVVFPTGNSAGSGGGGDDIVRTFTYQEAATASDSLWSLKPASATTAVIGKNLEVGGANIAPSVPADVTAAFPTGGGIVNAAAVVTKGAVIAGGAVRLANNDFTTPPSCVAGNKGDLYYDTTAGSMKVCNGAGTWGSMITGSLTLDAITAAAANQAGIDSGAHTVVWNWSTLADATTALTLAATNAGAVANTTLAVNNATTGAGYGVKATISGAGNTGSAVYGTNTSATGANYAGYFTNASATALATGLYAAETGGGNVTSYGIYGTNNASGVATTNAAGVYGAMSAAGNWGMAGYFKNSGVGLTINYGVVGELNSWGGAAVYGNAKGTAGPTSGGYFTNATTGGTSTGAGVYGAMSDAGNIGYGVKGTNAATGTAYGIYGSITGAGNTGYGVYGANTSATGANYGGYFTNASATANAVGVYGAETGGGAVQNFGGYFTTNATGTAIGVYATETGAGNTGYAVYGVNTSVTGNNIGGYFLNYSATAGAKGVFGAEASGGSAANFGGLFQTDTTGAGYGAYGQVTGVTVRAI